MTRDELRAIQGITEEQINAIMQLHGRDSQASAAREQNLQQQLDTAQNGLSALGALTPEQAVQQIATLNSQLAAQQAQYRLEGILHRAAREAGAVDEDDVIALIPNRDALLQSQNQDSDAAAAVAALKAKKTYLFRQAEATPPPADQDAQTPPPAAKPGIVVPKPNTPPPTATSVGDFAKMSGQQRMDLRSKDPHLFEQLVKQLRQH